jgi:alkaline phosphatase
MEEDGMTYRGSLWRKASLGGALALVLAGGVAAQEPAGPGETKETYMQRARAQVEANLRLTPNTRKARNVILFVGDGMGVTTVTAARILDGQLQGMKGEENALSFELFPYLAHSKTYQNNQQVPDSAPTMTALVTGSKANDGMLSIAPSVLSNDDWEASLKPENRLTTLLEQAEERGMWTGVVSTATVTHATPGACYAHTPNRGWESDADLPPDAVAGGFPDIARQLLEVRIKPVTMNGKPSPGLEVVLGGGRAYFLRFDENDPEDPEVRGERRDRSLVRAWQERGGAYVWDQKGFAAVDPAATGPLLGLFEPSYMKFELERSKDKAGEPSLTEMTEKAIQILQRGPQGFFLMVEAGRIDHGHHEGNAKKALTDAVELGRAVRKAAGMVGDDTLIIVTADHSHAFTMSGYPTRGNPILGLVVDNEPTGGPASKPRKAQDGKPYTTLGYANGPGAVPCTCRRRDADGQMECTCLPRTDLSSVDTTADSFQQQSLVPLSSETHGGEDVAIYACGPWAHLVQGTMEQNAVYFVMAKALGWW